MYFTLNLGRQLKSKYLLLFSKYLSCMGKEDQLEISNTCIWGEAGILCG